MRHGANDIVEVVMRYRRGHAVEQIMADLGVSWECVAHAFKRAGIPVPPRPASAAPPAPPPVMTYHPPLATKRMTRAADTRRRFEAGHTAAAIARAKKVTEETIRAHLREAGANFRADAEAGTPLAERRRAVQMYADGRTAEAIAEEMQVRRQTVLRWIREAGVPVRGRPVGPRGGTGCGRRPRRWSSDWPPARQSWRRRRGTG